MSPRAGPQASAGGMVTRRAGQLLQAGGGGVWGEREQLLMGAGFPGAMKHP